MLIVCDIINLDAEGANDRVWSSIQSCEQCWIWGKYATSHIFFLSFCSLNTSTLKFYFLVIWWIFWRYVFSLRLSVLMQSVKDKLNQVARAIGQPITSSITLLQFQLWTSILTLFKALTSWLWLFAADAIFYKVCSWFLQCLTPPPPIKENGGNKGANMLLGPFKKNSAAPK